MARVPYKELEKWALSHGFKPARLARELGVGTQLLNGWRKRGQVSADESDRVAAIIGAEKPPYVSPASLQSRIERRETHSVPRLDVRASMGDGIDIMDNVDIIDHVEINVPELCRARGISVSAASNLRIVTGFGNSMRPLFEHGDRLLVDCGVTDLRFDDVYCLEDEERLYIKRMQKVPGKPGVYMMKSDNKDYESFEIADPLRSGFKVLGRVVAALNINKV